MKPPSIIDSPSPFRRFSLRRLSDKCRDRWRLVRSALKRADGDVYTRRTSTQSAQQEAAGPSRGQEVVTNGSRPRHEEVASTSHRSRNSSQPPMRNSREHSSSTRYERSLTYRYRSETRMDAAELEKREQLEQWLMQQPLEKRKLDQSDRQVAMLAGTNKNYFLPYKKSTIAVCNATSRFYVDIFLSMATKI
ncbi:unnamed protein product [Cylicocyclus nassatus]|uniref:Uncharacterized protein n=1 Tax=Cylicocyclus nassatus TaxID=53992 RepID=A0AA36GLK1_CYLNA|nr:unnamed protein product [Cylicocyclus nassatus]